MEPDFFHIGPCCPEPLIKLRGSDSPRNWHHGWKVLKRRGNNFGGQDNTARYQFERVQCQATGIECDRRIYSKKLLTRRSGKGLLRELGLHFRLQHPRIVPVYMSFDDSENVFVLLQAVDGDLDVLLEDAGRSQEIQVQYGIARPLIEALSYLHNDHGIIHRGLQPSAIYFVGEKVMLGDFSLALCQRESLPMSVVGPPMYMAPEVLEMAVVEREGGTVAHKGDEALFDERVDIWSLGIILYEILFDAVPFRGATAREFMMSQKQDDPLGIPQRVGKISKNGRDFMEKCFELDRFRRPPAHILLLHGWLNINETVTLSRQASRFDDEDLEEQEEAAPIQDLEALNRIRGAMKADAFSLARLDAAAMEPAQRQRDRPRAKSQHDPLAMQDSRNVVGRLTRDTDSPKKPMIAAMSTHALKLAKFKEELDAADTNAGRSGFQVAGGSSNLSMLSGNSQGVTRPAPASFFKDQRKTPIANDPRRMSNASTANLNIPLTFYSGGQGGARPGVAAGESRRISGLIGGNSRRMSGLSAGDGQQTPGQSGYDPRRLSGLNGGNSRRMSGLSAGDSRRMSGLSGGDSRRLSGLSGEDSRRMSALSGDDSRRLSGQSGSDTRRLSGLVGFDNSMTSGLVGGDIQQTFGQSGQDPRRLSGLVGQDPRRLSGMTGGDPRRLSGLVAADSSMVSGLVAGGDVRRRSLGATAFVAPGTAAGAPVQIQMHMLQQPVPLTMPPQHLGPIASGPIPVLGHATAGGSAGTPVGALARTSFKSGGADAPAQVRQGAPEYSAQDVQPRPIAHAKAGSKSQHKMGDLYASDASLAPGTSYPVPRQRSKSMPMKDFVDGTEDEDDYDALAEGSEQRTAGPSRAGRPAVAVELNAYGVGTKPSGTSLASLYTGLPAAPAPTPLVRRSSLSATGSIRSILVTHDLKPGQNASPARGDKLGPGSAARKSSGRGVRFANALDDDDDEGDRMPSPQQAPVEPSKPPLTSVPPMLSPSKLPPMSPRPPPGPLARTRSKSVSSVPTDARPAPSVAVQAERDTPLGTWGRLLDENDDLSSPLIVHLMDKGPGSQQSRDRPTPLDTTPEDAKALGTSPALPPLPIARRPSLPARAKQAESGLAPSPSKSPPKTPRALDNPSPPERTRTPEAPSPMRDVGADARTSIEGRPSLAVPTPEARAQMARAATSAERSPNQYGSRGLSPQDLAIESLPSAKRGLSLDSQQYQQGSRRPSGHSPAPLPEQPGSAASPCYPVGFTAASVLEDFLHLGTPEEAHAHASDVWVQNVHVQEKYVLESPREVVCEREDTRAQRPKGFFSCCFRPAAT